MRIDIRYEITYQHILDRTGLDLRVGHIAVYVPAYGHCLRGDYDDRVHFSSADGGMDYPDHPGSLPLIGGSAVKIAKIKIPPPLANFQK